MANQTVDFLHLEYPKEPLLDGVSIARGYQLLERVFSPSSDEKLKKQPKKKNQVKALLIRTNQSKPVEKNRRIQVLWSPQWE